MERFKEGGSLAAFLGLPAGKIVGTPAAVSLHAGHLWRSAELEHRHRRLRQGQARKTHPLAGRRLDAISSTSIRPSRRNRPPKQPIPPAGSTSPSRFRRTSARRPPRIPRSRPTPCSCRRASPSTRRPPTARPRARTRRLTSAAEDEAQCPEDAKIGTTSLDYPTSCRLRSPGAIYLGEPRPGDRYRIILVADGFATHVKFVGSVRPDPNTGQLTAVFDDLPQSPFTEFDLHFFGSERGILATPNQCGTFAVNTEFVPWATELSNQTATQFFSMTSGPNGQSCPGAQRPFAPGFRAVGGGNGAGAPQPRSPST